MASTYPLEVVEAQRWVQDPKNASLKGDQLAAALEQQPWDPSVKSLVPFPSVLAMMDNNLQWTEQLGDAFLAQQPQVMDSVQHLRQEAQAAGKLKSTPQQVVTTQAQDIIIQPANPQVVYVPYYNPEVVYGTWGYPAYPPYYFAPPPGIVFADAIGFGIGLAILAPFWGWDRWDWHSHGIIIDNGRFSRINFGRPPIGRGDVWQHDPAHRGGVPYRNAAVRARFGGAANQNRSAYRGYNANVARSNAVADRSRVAPQEHQAMAQRDNSAHQDAARQNAAVHSDAARTDAARATPAASHSAPMFESMSHGSRRAIMRRAALPAAWPRLLPGLPWRFAWQWGKHG